MNTKKPKTDAKKVATKKVAKKTIVKKVSTKASSKVSKKAILSSNAKGKAQLGKKINTKVSSEFAIVVVFLLAVVVGFIFWQKNNEEIQAATLSTSEKPSVERKIKTLKDKNEDVSKTCKSRYYEGLIEIAGWFVSQDEGGIVIAVKKDEISKLPNTDSSQYIAEDGGFKLKLVDPTEEIASKIKASSKEKPATFTVKGYAEICQQPPLLSIQKATVAFKKK
ncbi:MAG: hypothetical protein WCJ51_04885 [Candidatus Moraniibacteriota bacterium]